MSSSRSLGIVRSLIRTSSSSRFRLADAAILYLFRPHPVSQAALRHAIGRLIGEPALRQRLSIETMRVVDGKGAERIVRVALEILHRAKS